MIDLGIDYVMQYADHDYIRVHFRCDCVLDYPHHLAPDWRVGFCGHAHADESVRTRP